MKIGLIITPYKLEELDKEEIIPIDEEREWLNEVNQKFIIEDKNKDYVPDDISIYYYLKNTYKKKHIIEYIFGNDPLIYEKVKRCDVVFLLIFDMLEAFHTLSQKEFNEMKRTFELPNVYPPYIFQNFINNKNKYYDYLKKHQINVLPMVYVSSNEFKKNPKATVNKILKIQRGDDDAFIGKPIFGQEKIDFQKFVKNTEAYKVVKYLERISSIYDGCIFQPYIKYLAEKYEYRSFFIGDKYYYTIQTHSPHGTNVYSDKFINMDDTEEGRDILLFTKKVFSVLPQLKMGTSNVEKLVTRIDVSCCFETQRYFVSEIEFVPSLFTDLKEVVDLKIDQLIAEQIIVIAEQINLNSIQPKENSRVVFNKKWVILLFVGIFILFLIIVFILSRSRRKNF